MCLQNRKPESVKVKSFIETVTALIQVIKTGANPEGFNKEQMRMLTVGHYAEHLATWFKHFDQEQILILFTDEFEKRPFATMRKILTFLGVSQIDYSSITQQNKSGRWDLISPPLSGNLIQQDKKPEWINAFLGAIDPEAQEMLNDYYQPWNQKLRHLLPRYNIPW